MRVRVGGRIRTLLCAAALSVVAVGAEAQDIKLGFNGDLSASRPL